MSTTAPVPRGAIKAFREYLNAANRDEMRREVLKDAHDPTKSSARHRNGVLVFSKKVLTFGAGRLNLTRMPEQSKYRKLPSGKVTTSVTRYIREWRSLCKDVAKALDCEVLGYDPGISLVDRCPSRPLHPFSLPAHVAERIRTLVKNQNPTP